MEAIRVEKFGPPEVMNLVEIETPEPAEGQLLIQVKAIGVNPVETYVRNGTYPVLPELPFTPGLDAAGVIEKCGAGVTNFKAGDRIYCSRNLTGSYAEYTLCTEDQAYPLPDSVSFQAGAAVGVSGAAAWRALFIRGDAQPGETILIHGASGSVGMTAIQLAKAHGLTVIGTAGTDKGMQLIDGMGADVSFNHRDPQYLGALKKYSEVSGINLIIEMLANINLGHDLDLLSPRGRVVIIGSRGTLEMDPRATMGKELDIRGLSLFNATPEETRRTHLALGEAMKSGVFKPVISRVMTLSDAAKAHDMVMQDGNGGKIILEIT